jgi:hypothetical protein
MKKPMHRLLLLVLLLSCSSLAFAGPTTYSINFEQLGAYTQVTSQYSADDVTFTNAMQVTEPDFNYFEFPPHSGAGAITDDPGNPITLSFATGVASVSGWYADPYGVVITAYDASDNVLDVIDGTGVDGSDLSFYLTAAFNSDPITSVTISDDGYGANGPDGEIVDDLTITATPEPGSFLLLGTGLLGLAGALRRKFAR